MAIFPLPNKRHLRPHKDINLRQSLLNLPESVAQDKHQSLKALQCRNVSSAETKTVKGLTLLTREWKKVQA